MNETTLARYYRAIDDGRIDDALDMLSEKAEFVITLPSGTRRGRGREDMGGYLFGRGVPDRAHVMLRAARVDDVEFFYGRVTEGTTPTGHFLAAARIDDDGRIASYQVAFDVEHTLVEDR